MDAINLVFDPLKARPIYKTKLVILLDQPNGEHKQARFEAFKNTNRFLQRNGQLYVLDVNGLEDYYPSTLTEQCKFNDKKKKAKWMAAQITQEQFESDMPIIFQALEKCWQEAYTEG